MNDDFGTRCGGIANHHLVDTGDPSRQFALPSHSLTAEF